MAPAVQNLAPHFIIEIMRLPEDNPQSESNRHIEVIRPSDHDHEEQVILDTLTKAAERSKGTKKQRDE